MAITGIFKKISKGKIEEKALLKHSKVQGGVMHLSSEF
jgi:hypothetical protein